LYLVLPSAASAVKFALNFHQRTQIKEQSSKLFFFACFAGLGDLAVSDLQLKNEKWKMSFREEVVYFAGAKTDGVS
jgi:hypothetical protein